MIYLDSIPSDLSVLPIDLRVNLREYSEALSPVSDGWKIFYDEQFHDLDWEAGAALARKNGYKHLEVTTPGVLPPIMWLKEKVVTFYSDAVELLIIGRFETHQQPAKWSGEIQIKDPRRQWTERRFGLIKTFSTNP